MHSIYILKPSDAFWGSKFLYFIMHIIDSTNPKRSNYHFQYRCIVQTCQKITLTFIKLVVLGMLLILTKKVVWLIESNMCTMKYKNFEPQNASYDSNI